MGGDAPINIQRLIKQNEYFSKAKEYADQITKGSVVSGWHEKQLQNTGATGRSGRTGSPCAAPTHEMQAEISSANQSLSLVRKEKLRRLLQDETLLYEQQLQALGLSLVKHRD